LASARYAHGALVVALAPLRQVDQVPLAIAQACGLKEQPGRPLIATICDALRDRELLLVLDNCEHLLAARSFVAELLAAAPGLRVLATSRALLDLRDEQVYPLQPLPCADPAQLPALDELAEVPAIALLLNRARAHSPSFQLTARNAQAIASICVQLDGLPLALELAAALFATVQGDTACAITLHKQNLALSQALGLLRPRANALTALGTMASRQGDTDQAIT